MIVEKLWAGRGVWITRSGVPDAYVVCVCRCRPPSVERKDASRYRSARDRGGVDQADLSCERTCDAREKSCFGLAERS